MKCDCGAKKAQTLHAHWCSVHESETIIPFEMCSEKGIFSTIVPRALRLEDDVTGCGIRVLSRSYMKSLFKNNKKPILSVTFSGPLGVEKFAKHDYGCPLLNRKGPIIVAVLSEAHSKLWWRDGFVEPT